jgi:hypothetical protein
LSIPLSEWLDVISGEYLDGYISEGGAAVKLVVPQEANARVKDRLTETARDSGFLVAAVDAGVTRVDRIHDLFTAVSRQVDWLRLAENVRERAVMESNYQPPTEPPLTFDSVAHANGDIAPHFVRSALERWFSEHIFRDYRMSQDFRTAMSRLCFDPLTSAAGTESPLLDSVVDWLRGELRLMSAVKQAQIYQRVARHNARDLLLSLSHWVRVAGMQGLVVMVDIQATAPKSKALAGSSNFYTRAALYDLYEVIRQFIDSTDEMDGCLLTFIAPPDAIEDEVRGLYMYRALTMRIADEVRDRRQDNPLASLVRISTEGTHG